MAGPLSDLDLPPTRRVSRVVTRRARRVRSLVGLALVALVAAAGAWLLSLRGDSASPELDRSVYGPALKGACGVVARFAALTLDLRASDQGRLVIG